MTEEGRFLMRSSSSPSFRAPAYLRHIAAVGFTAVIVSMPGCGVGDPPRTDAQLEQDAKVQALMKDGKSIGQIRAFLKGEPDPTKKQTKTRRKK
jgi:hypothetical protein